MGSSPDAWAEQLRQLRETFVLTLPQRISEIQTGWSRVRGKPTDTAALAVLTLAVHSLAGSAGSFGYSELGTQARRVELEIESQLRSGTAEFWQQNDLEALEAGIASLIALASAGPDSVI